ncbi:MAG: UbiH/UbiF/VisC/COQ6 family ubiquinone biosynthesis hydroxylase [Gammaproteobacteria bacterium]
MSAQAPAWQDVVVIGGGMVGATVACALAEQGLRVTVVEAREPGRFDSDADYDARVSAVSPGSEMILKALGAWPSEHAARLCPYRNMHVWDAAGPGEIHFDCCELHEPRLGYIVEHRVLQHALVRRLHALGEVTWRCPDELAHFAVTEDHVAVELAGGAQVSARLLIGADGAHSLVRTLAGIMFHARDYDHSALIATAGTQLPHAHTAWQRFVPDGVLAFLPLADGRCAIVWSIPDARARALAAMPDDDFKHALGAEFDYRLGHIDACGPRAVFPLRGGQADRYVLPRVALIGDAAHGIHPLAGLGANLGFMDAAVLAETIGESRRDIGSLRVLRRYERARRGDNELTMRAMEGFKFLFERQATGWRWLRGMGVNMTDAATPLKRLIMRRAMGLSGERPRLARG